MSDKIRRGHKTRGGGGKQKQGPDRNLRVLQTKDKKEKLEKHEENEKKGQPGGGERVICV